MIKQGTKPFANKSETTTPRPPAKSAAAPPVAVRQVSPVSKPVLRPAPKAAAPAPRQAASPLGAPKRSTHWTVEAADRVQPPRPPAKRVAAPPVAVRQVSQVAKPVLRPAPKAAAPTQRQAASTLGAPQRSTPWTVEAAGRVQRTIAVKNGGKVEKGSLAAEAMSKATKGAPPPKPRTK